MARVLVQERDGAGPAEAAQAVEAVEGAGAAEPAGAARAAQAAMLPEPAISAGLSAPLTCRFAPSPSGRMHAGNIYAALVSWLVAKSTGGRVVLRIEDLDVERSKDAWASQVQRDFEALGLTWDAGPFYQQGRAEAYACAFRTIAERGSVFPCFCTRADLHAASAPHRGEKLVYPGTCRHLTDAERARRREEREPAWRLEAPDATYAADDLIQGRFVQNLARECGDFVIRRSDGLFAYQLAVVVDDAEQGVNCVVRGVDLLVSTPQQMYLQDLLGAAHPRYAHVPLLVGEPDRRLSKRDRDAGLDELLARYKTPTGVVGHVAFIAGLAERDEPASPQELLAAFDLPAYAAVLPDKVQIPFA